VKHILRKHTITDVIHFAAETHVDNSILNPEIFVTTNVLGTSTLLGECLSFWKEIGTFETSRFHHISTDEVYGTLGLTGLFSETTPYAPNSPYSASKASSDMMVRAFHETYNMNTVITNCSNNYGPKQHHEKLIPKVIKNALEGKDIPIYGNGENIRDWLYVEDHCSGIDLAFRTGNSGETYNIGGRNEKKNIEIVYEICDIMNMLAPKHKPYFDQVKFVDDRPGHDLRYAIDASKIENQLGWKAKETFATGIVKTVEWYLKEFGAIK
jgi:dTDP-glucose 4,6-dehydratase